LSETKSAFLIEAALASDAAARRVTVRSAHLARLRQLIARGEVIAVGALEDLSESILLVRSEDEAAARALVVADVYATAGVWTEFRIRPIQLVEP
jgi:uncharacterized protein